MTEIEYVERVNEKQIDGNGFQAIVREIDILQVMQQMEAAWELDELIVSDMNVLELLHLPEIDRVDGVQLIVIEDEEFQTLQVQQGRIDVRDRIVFAVQSAQR